MPPFCLLYLLYYHRLKQEVHTLPTLVKRAWAEEVTRDRSQHTHAARQWRRRVLQGLLAPSLVPPLPLHLIDQLEGLSEYAAAYAAAHANATVCVHPGCNPMPQGCNPMSQGCNLTPPGCNLTCLQVP